MAQIYSYHHATLISTMLMLIHLAFENIAIALISALQSNKGQYNTKHKTPEVIQVNGNTISDS